MGIRRRNRVLAAALAATSIAMALAVWGSVREAAADDVYVKADLSVSTPEEIRSDAQGATLKLVAEGTNLDRIDRVVWTISYYDFYERKDVYLAPITRPGLEDLTVAREGGDLSIAGMDGLCRQFGATREGSFGLTFTVSVEAFAGGRSVGKSPLLSAIFDFIALRDLSLAITGPVQIRPGESQASFNLQCGGKDMVRVQSVGWFFEYHTDEEGWVQDLWGGWVPVPSQDQFGVVKPADAALQLMDGGSPLNLSLFRELAETHGSLSGEDRVLEMRAYVRAYLTNYATLVTLEKSSPHQFRVFAGQGPLSLDLYPTEPNQTRVRLEGNGKDPVSIAVEKEPPAHIVLDYPKLIAPKDGSYPYLEIEVELDPSRARNLVLPAQEEIVFITKSGTDEESNFTLKLSLKKAEWLIMVYLAHDTDPSLQTRLTSLLDICDISRELDSPRVGIMALADMTDRVALDARLYGVGSIPPNNAQLFRVIRGNLTQLGADWGSIDMSLPATLQRFLTQCVAREPAQHLHLVLSGHGHGMLGALIDKSHRETWMTIPQLDMAMANHRFDVLSFEACVMGQIEALCDLREHAEYITASERTVPAGLRKGLTYLSGGYAWQELLRGLLTRPDTAAREYATQIVQTYRDRYSEGGSFRTSATLAAIETDKLPSLVNAISALGWALAERYRTGSELYNRTVEKMVKKSWEANCVPCTDIRDLCQNIIAEPSGVLRGLVEKAQAVIDAFDRAIVANTEIIFKHPRLALFLDEVGLGGKVDEWARISSGYSGLTMFLWRDTISGKPGEIYRWYLSRFDGTEFRTNGWREFVEAFCRSHPSSSTSINLHHPLHELYLHVYDEEEYHVGINPASESLDGLDMEIPGSYYLDFHNGTKTVLIPIPGNATATNLTVVVDGTRMEEEEEDYTLLYQCVQDDLVTDTETVTGRIERDTNHMTVMSIHGGRLEIGETKETSQTGPDGEDEEPDKEPDKDGSTGLPGWFSENLPFLVPLLEPILPYAPEELVPILPILLLGVPVLILILVIAAATRKSKRGSKTKDVEKGQDGKHGRE